MTDSQTPDSNRHLTTGIALAVLSAAAYSTNTPLAATILAGDGSATGIIFCRALGAMILSGTLLALQKDRPAARVGAGTTLLLALFLFAQGGFYVASVAYIPVSLAALVFFTWPVWVGVGDTLAARNHARPGQLGYFLTALIGLAIALQADFQALNLRGLLLALGGALSMATYVSLVAHRLPGDASPLAVNATTNAGVALIALPILLYSGEFSWPQGGGLIALPLIVGFYTLATLAQILAIRHAGGALAALFFNVEPVGSIILAAILLGETFEGQQILGGTIVVAALLAYAIHTITTSAIQGH